MPNIAVSHGNRTKAEMVWLLCIGCVLFLDIQVPKMYNFTFLDVMSVEMAKSWKG